MGRSTIFLWTLVFLYIVIFSTAHVINEEAIRAELCKKAKIVGRNCTDAEDILMKECIVLSEAKENQSKELNNAIEDAAKLEFLQFYRSKLISVEERCFPSYPPMPEYYQTDKYFEKVKPRFKDIESYEIPGDKHSMKWFWMFVFCDKIECNTQVETLRALLRYNPKQYRWFAEQVVRMYELRVNDYISPIESDRVNLKYLKYEQVKKYIYLLNPDMREAARIFFTSEGWLPHEF